MPLRPRTIARAAGTLRRAYSTSKGIASDFVRIVEVGPRDGLQNEKVSIPLATKIELVQRLAKTGLETIEAGSFVHPKWVPQMANSSSILDHTLAEPPTSDPDTPVKYQWLLPNLRGLETYFASQDAASATSTSSNTPTSSQKHEVSIFLAATESFSQRNTNCSISESIDRFKPLIAAAQKRNVPVRAYISVALGCPYEGPEVSPTTVTDLALRLLDLGAYEISVADTTGMGTPPSTARLLQTLTAAGIRPESLAFHFHDTYGLALVNTLVALESGVRTFDSAVAGLGGCPYSPGATGNVATEDLIHCLHGVGMETGVDLERVADVGAWISGELGKGNESRAGRAVLARSKI